MQYRMNEDLQDFLDPHDGMKFLNGNILCIVALIVWVWSILRDLLQNFRFTRAVLTQPRGDAHIQAGDPPFIGALGCLQYLSCLLFCTVPRAALGSFLGYIGIKFLIYTTNMSDLLLNAMALGFVLEIDELMYEVFCPGRIKRLTATVAPLTVVLGSAHARLIRGGFMPVLFRLVTSGTILALFCINMLQPQLKIMQDVLDELCGGNRNFVYVANKASGIVHFTQTIHLEENCDGKICYDEGYTKTAVNELKNTKSLDAPISPPLLYSMKDSWTLLNRHFASDRSFALSQMQCIDHTDMEQLQERYHSNVTLSVWQLISRVYLQRQFSNASIMDCKNVNKSLCNVYTNSVLRALCPIHCGCDEAWSGLVFGTSKYGCPQMCDSQYENSLKDYVPSPLKPYGFTDCKDSPPEVLKFLPSFQSYLDGLQSALPALGLYPAQVAKIDHMLRKKGCEALEDPTLARVVDLCQDTVVGRTMRPFCPVQCECTITDNSGCPPACRCYMQSGVGQVQECGSPDSLFYKKVNEWSHNLIHQHLSEGKPDYLDSHLGGSLHTTTAANGQEVDIQIPE
jgi:hypothetical protein